MVKNYYDVRNNPFDPCYECQYKIKGLLLGKRLNHELIFVLKSVSKTNTSGEHSKSNLKGFLIKNNGPSILYVYQAKNLIDAIKYWINKKSPMSWLNPVVNAKDTKDLFKI